MTGPLVVTSCDAHLVREDVRERRLAEARAGPQKRMWSSGSPRRRAASTKTREVLLVLGLADVVVEGARAERAIEARVVALGPAVGGARFFGGSGGLLGFRHPWGT